MEIVNYISIMLLFVPLSPTFPNDSKLYVLEIVTEGIEKFTIDWI